MSVINKVLRDLDQRKGAGRMQSPLEGTAVAAGGAQRRWWNSPAVWLLLLLVVSAVGLVAWQVERDAPASSPNASIDARLNSQPAQPANASPVRQTESVQPVVTAAPTTGSASAPQSTPAPLAVPAMTVPKVALKPPATVDAPPRPMPSASAPAPMASPEVFKTHESAPPVRPQARLQDKAPEQKEPAPVGSTLTQVTQEVLAQAQAQWSRGDHSGAVQLVRDLLARWPRDEAQHVDLLAQAVREYARMTMAQERPTDALAMLVQWEKPLAPVADIWALRGQVAQRMGLHAPAVQAYTSALERSPGQARWMLAAAVSLAAQGQTAPAADLAEKARRVGFLPPDVANYLQQLGVVLHSP